MNPWLIAKYGFFNFLGPGNPDCIGRRRRRVMCGIDWRNEVRLMGKKQRSAGVGLMANREILLLSKYDKSRKRGKERKKDGDFSPFYLSLGVNPTRLFFFVNEEFFRFSLLSLAVLQCTHFFSYASNSQA